MQVSSLQHFEDFLIQGLSNTALSSRLAELVKSEASLLFQHLDTPPCFFAAENDTD